MRQLIRWRRAALGAGLVLLAAGCAAPPAKPAAPSLQVVTPPLSTSLVTAQGTWAVAVMGGLGRSAEQLLAAVRPAPRREPLVAGHPAGRGRQRRPGRGRRGPSLLVGFRPSQGLAFSPLAASTDTGKNWKPGLLDADLADVPDALAEGAAGQALALLGNGSIQTAPDGAAASAGRWSPLASLHTLAASAPGRGCGWWR